MAHGTLGFVGREAELAVLHDAVLGAKASRGSMWLLVGDAGIGKSRLVEEAASAAEREGFRVLWGRCWEAGGAPAFWPWIQVVREALRHAERAMLTGARAAHLVQLVPELHERFPELAAPPPSAGDNAQFMLLDAVASALCAAAREAPLFVALEDLHVATPSALLLLDLLAQQSRGAPLVVIGTTRSLDVPGETSHQLQRIAQTGRTLALAPLERDDVAAFLGQATGRTPTAAMIDTVTDRTEGNPLFLVELCRLLIARGEAQRERVSSELVPPSLRTALQRRLADLAPATRECLELAATVGRDFSLVRLATTFGRVPEELRVAVDDATRASILTPAGEGSYRFTHILLREVLHQELPAARRESLHLQVAHFLEATAVERTTMPWSVIAHHYFAAGPEARDKAIDATERAAQQAVSTLAFAEAMTCYRTALQTVDLAPVRHPVRRAELMIGLGHAQLHGGDPQAGRDACLAAAALARELAAPELLARAALELGSVLTFAKVDPVLVSLLQDALGAIGTTNDRLRARVMARLAAAMQPSEEPLEPIRIALEAVELARTTHDRRTLLATLSSASSAMVDNVEAAQRVPIDREHVTLAAALGDGAEQLRGELRLALGCFELGDLAGARASVNAVRAHASALAHPFYRWRGPAADAMVALWEGRFGEAEDLIERAAELGNAGGDPNAHPASVYQRIRLAQLTGRRDALRTLLVQARQVWSGTMVSEVLMRVFVAAQSLALTPSHPSPAVTRRELEMCQHDRSSIESVAELAHVMREREIATKLLATIDREHSKLVTTGVIGLTWSGPASRVRSLLLQILGHTDEAIDAMTEAVTTCRDLAGRPLVASLGEELARLLTARGRDADLAAARTHRDEAHAIASELGMGLVLERLAAGPRPATHPATERPSPTSFTLVRSGELWTVSHGDASFQLRDTKGLRYLARLLVEPARELHVLDLADALDAVDAGDAGELLDPRARDAYKARVRSLEEELADAEARNDLGAAERASHELELIQAELARALGLRGRARRAGAAAEKARINVQRRVRSAIAQIAQHDPALARHLERSVRTGVFCCYEPE